MLPPAQSIKYLFVAKHQPNTHFYHLSSIMKFTATALAVAIAASFGVNPIMGKLLKGTENENGRELRRKQGRKGSKLQEYEYIEPANFAGWYRQCFLSITRSSASGIGDATYHGCTPDGPPSPFVLQVVKGDDYGAFKAVQLFDAPDEAPDFTLGGFQGYANGNTLSMGSFGEGTFFFNLIANAVEVVLHNDLPDSLTCTLYKDGILESTAVMTEYCSEVSLEDDISADACANRVGKWLNTYTTKFVSVLDGFDCPAPPPGFCESNPIPGGGPLPDEGGPGSNTRTRVRHLDDEEGENLTHNHTCPILAAQMNG